MTDEQYKVVSEETMGIFDEREIRITGLENAIDKISTQYYNQAIDDAIKMAKTYSRYSFESMGSSQDLIRDLEEDLITLKIK